MLKVTQPLDSLGSFYTLWMVIKFIIKRIHVAYVTHFLPFCLGAVASDSRSCPAEFPGRIQLNHPHCPCCFKGPLFWSWDLFSERSTPYFNSSFSWISAIMPEQLLELCIKCSIHICFLSLQLTKEQYTLVSVYACIVIQKT